MRAFEPLAQKHLGVRHDLVALPIQHDTPGELAQPHGRVRDWRAGECEPLPGVTMPAFSVVERDYGALAQKWAALGPLVETAGCAVKGAAWRCEEEVALAAVAQRPAAPRRHRRRPAAAGPRHRRRRGDPRALRRLQRTARVGRLQIARAAHRRETGRPRERDRRVADRLPRHAGAAAAGDDLARVVGDRREGPPLQRLHDQHRAAEAVAHAQRPHAPLPGPRVDARAGRGAARPTGRRSTSARSTPARRSRATARAS